MELLWAGAAARVGLLAWGQWQDAHLAVKFTDIDYEVYTDAAAFMAAGHSPYRRSTYRYSPLLAGALVPNATLWKGWGKALFSAADLLAAWLFVVLLRRRGAALRLQRWGAALWLFSPLTATISTRGNGEALVTCMLLGLLLALDAGRLVPAALLYGLAVHWRVYPIVFALPLLRHYALEAQQAQRAQRARQPRSHAAPPAGAGLAARARAAATAAFTGLASWRGAAFGALSGGLFLGLGGILYRLYGWQFLHETYLYHASRTDPRHNFSPYFYPAYLDSSAAGAAGAAGGSTSAAGVAGPGAAGSGGGRWDVGWAFSLAQLVLQGAVGWRCAADLPWAFLLQTTILVAFNKVCTAQYFVWYLTFVPLVLPDLAAAPNRARLQAAAGALAAAMAHWLGWAYLLEFQGARVHLAVWGASLAFLAAHAWLLCELLAAWRARQQGGGGGGGAAARRRQPKRA